MKTSLLFLFTHCRREMRVENSNYSRFAGEELPVEHLNALLENGATDAPNHRAP